MKFCSTVTAALALTSSAFAAAATTTPSPLDTLVNGVLANNAAVRETIANVRAQNISVDTGRGYVNGNVTSIKTLAAAFNATVVKLLAEPGSLTYSRSGLPSRMSRAMSTLSNDVVATYFAKSPLLDPLLPVEEIVQLAGEVAPQIIENVIFIPLNVLFYTVFPAIINSSSTADTPTDASSVSSSSIQAPLDSLVKGVLANDAAMNNTLVSFLANIISNETAQTSINGSASTVKGLVSTFNSTTGSLFAKSAAGSIGPDQAGAMVGQVGDAVMKMMNDVVSTYYPSPNSGFGSQCLLLLVLLALALVEVAGLVAFAGVGLVIAILENLDPNLYGVGANVPF